MSIDHGGAAAPLNLETARLLTKDERARVRAAHVFTWWLAGGRHYAACDGCDTSYSSPHLHEVSSATRAHVSAAMDFAAGRKCAEARANGARHALGL